MCSMRPSCPGERYILHDALLEPLEDTAVFEGNAALLDAVVPFECERCE